MSQIQEAIEAKTTTKGKTMTAKPLQQTSVHFLYDFLSFYLTLYAVSQIKITPSFFEHVAKKKEERKRKKG